MYHLVLGAYLLSVAAVDAIMFFSRGNRLNADAKCALIISSVAAAIGLLVDVWYIFAYTGADALEFEFLAVNRYGSIFFILLSLLPLFALLVALGAFLSAVAFLDVITPTAHFNTLFAISLVFALAGGLLAVCVSYRSALVTAWVGGVRVRLGALYASRSMHESSARSGAAAAVAQKYPQAIPRAVPPVDARAPRRARHANLNEIKSVGANG
jgi:hypothetical protein